MTRTSRWVHRQRDSLRLAAQGLRGWGPRQYGVAAVAALAVALVVGLATVLIPNPVFGREIPPEPWNYPVWILTSVLMGLLIATYVRPPDAAMAGAGTAAEGPASAAVAGTGMSGGVMAAGDEGPSGTVDVSERRSARVGGTAGVLAWFAVGCPVCNKIALLALGYTGALTWFAPLQPVLAVAALALAAVALVWRLRGQVACPMPAMSRAAG